MMRLARIGPRQPTNMPMVDERSLGSSWTPDRCDIRIRIDDGIVPHPVVRLRKTTYLWGTGDATVVPCAGRPPSGSKR